MELNPNYAQAYQWEGARLMTLGRYDESLASIKRALAIDPTSAGINFYYSFGCSFRARPTTVFSSSRSSPKWSRHFRGRTFGFRTLTGRSGITKHRSRNASKGPSGAKALAIFCGGDEGFDHLRVDIVAVESIQFPQPEIITGIIRVGSIVRIAAEVAKVLHQHERPVEFLIIQRRVLDHAPQRSSSGRHVDGIRRRAEFIDGRLPIAC